MPEDKKDIIEHLKRIEYLLAAILLGRKPNVKEVAKAIKVSDNTLTAIFPDKGKGKKSKVETNMSAESEKEQEENKYA